MPHSSIWCSRVVLPMSCGVSVHPGRGLYPSQEVHLKELDCSHSLTAGLQWVNCSHDYSIHGREAGQAKHLADLGMEGLSPYLVDF